MTKVKNFENAATIATTFREGAKDEERLDNGINVTGISELFRSLGYDCEIDSKLLGTSGTRHQFDIVAKRGSEIVVIDFVTFRNSLLDAPMSEQESQDKVLEAAIRMHVKGWDCQAYHTIIAHFSSSLQDENQGDMAKDVTRRQFAQALRDLKVELIESPDIKGIVSNLTNKFCSLETV